MLSLPYFLNSPLRPSHLVLIGIQNYVLGIIEDGTSYKDTLIFFQEFTLEGIEKSSAGLHCSSFGFHKPVSLVSLFLLY